MSASMADSSASVWGTKWPTVLTLLLDERQGDHRAGHAGGLADPARRQLPSARSGGANARAIPCPSTGEKLPLVTSPTAVPVGEARRRRSGAAGGPRWPGRPAGGPRRLAFSRSRAARPRNPSGFDHDTTQPRPACSGVIPGPSSWPCRGRAASRRSVSRAPSPAGCTPVASTASQNEAATSAGHGALDPVLAGVAGAGGHAGLASPGELGHPEAAHARPPRETTGQALPGGRSLDGDDGPFGGDVRAAQGAADPGGVRGVRHDVEALVVHPPHDDVVEHRPVGVVEQVGVLGPAGADLAQVVGQGRLQQVPGPAGR